ncbi:ribonuclease H-like domain-containing protein [Tanacetum coccineum]
MGIIEDRLCIFDTCDNGRPRGIWVIKNYNVKPSWELLPDDYEMKDNVVHHMKMITDCDHMKMTFFCDDNILLSGDVKYIESPIFVQTLVSPYSNNEKSSHTKNKNREVKDNRNIKEVYNLKDGETERKKRKRKGSRNRKKNGSKEKREIDENREVCLIIDDRPNSNLTSKQAKEKIASKGIQVSKRKLCDSYDMFYADKRVVPFLPKLLGKHFFRSRKLPLGVDLGHSERGFKVGLLSLRHLARYGSQSRRLSSLASSSARCKECFPPWTRVDTESKLGADGTPVSHPTLYRSLVGALQCLTFTRHDFSYAVQQLYSSSTSYLVAYSDADWAGCPTTRRSTLGYCWSSKRQYTLSRSSVEAEYRGVDNAVVETSWLRNLLRELHSLLHMATIVYCDNVSAVYLSSNPVQHQRSKHIEIDIHFVRDQVAKGLVLVLHAPSRYQYADIFTKGLPFALFDEFRTSLSVLRPPAPTARVVKEVLLRLTVKDLCQCKSVCKSWYSLISSPYFVKLHLKLICKKEDKNNKQHRNKRITVISGCGISNGCYYTLKIEGSSNGLVCISSLNQLFLTNPSTREFQELQKPPILPEMWKCYGFGYDSSTDDYKLVTVTYHLSNGALAHTLSLKSNAWKHFGHVNYSFYDNKPGILFNGALHWFWFDANYTRDRKALIVSFDLAKEEFIEIPQPDDPRYDWSYGSRLGIIEDRLCIFHERDDRRPFRIWVMKNYNVKPSWELLPDHYKMKDNVVQYMEMIMDCDHKKKPTFFCDDKMWRSRYASCIGYPLFVQTLVSPYSNNGKSSHTKNKNRGVKDNRDIEEVYDLKDEETERKKRKDSRNIYKDEREKREIDEIREG